MAVCRGIYVTHEDKFLSVLKVGFGLSSDYTRLYTEFCIGSTEQTGSFHRGHRELVVLKRSREKHLVVGSCSVPYILRDMVKHFVVRFA